MCKIENTELYILQSGKKRRAVCLICKYCNKEYIVSKSCANRSKYCNSTCFNFAQRNRIILYCAYCNKEIERTPKALKNNKTGLFFCGKECQDLSRLIGGLEQYQHSNCVNNTCKNCDKLIRSTLLYCKDCFTKLRYAQNNTITEFECQRCNKNFLFGRKNGKRIGHSQEYCNGCHTTLRRQAFKLKAIEYKGGKCIRCGYNKCRTSLCFHHINPKEKEFTISRSMGRKWELTEKELDKCILLCHNCHGELHEGLWELDTI